MSENNEQKKWKEYCKNQLAVLSPMLYKLGFELEKEQPNLSGEKYLMQAVTTVSGKKLILFARRINDNKRVVIKATNDSGGISEIEHEYLCRTALKNINFAYSDFFYPKEILFKKYKGYTITIQQFIEQECSFLERPLKEQFLFAIKAFKIQEGAHATTYKHKKNISKTFGEKKAEDYIFMFNQFQAIISDKLPDEKELIFLLKETAELIKKHLDVIDRYSGFLTHIDFVPHNFRIVENNIYLLDASSLRFGNKYEGWARFMNFMTLYNCPLEEALIFYIRNNRSKEEYRSLELMRMYRLGEIISFYVNMLGKTSGNLKILTKYRIEFWKDVLKATLKNKLISADIVNEYKKNRDKLRSEDEKKRQIGLH